MPCKSNKASVWAQVLTVFYSILCLSTTCAAASSNDKHSKFCVVVRTYWGHGQNSPSGLRQLLQSLQRQHITNWEAVLVVLDSQPFAGLPYILQDLNDTRVWVFAEWIAPEYAPKTNGAWNTGYHDLLYHLTDEAIRACPRDTRWLIVTNGDNEYASDLFAQIAPHKDAELVALDYYSRYQRSTALPCERFKQEAGAPACKQNLLRWCHTDLGANVLHWPKLLAGNHRFGELAPFAGGLSAEHFDGVLVHKLLVQNWVVAHLNSSCLCDHSPSPQRCARTGGVWDDSDNLVHSGGTCIAPSEASRKVREAFGGIVEVNVQLSHDGRLSSFMPDGQQAPETIKCLRQLDIAAQHQAVVNFYGLHCTAIADIAAITPMLDPAWQQAAEQQLQLEQLQHMHQQPNGARASAQQPQQQQQQQYVYLPHPPPETLYTVLPADIPLPTHLLHKQPRARQRLLPQSSTVSDHLQAHTQAVQTHDEL